MNLRSLLAQVPAISTLPDHPALEEEVKGLSANSQGCGPGDLFLGMPGTRVDGGEFWPSAIGAGAIAALISPAALAAKPIEAGANAPCLIPVDDMVAACAEVAAAFAGFPVRSLPLVGVTGTNGKTTTTHIIEYLLNQANQPAAILGTLYARWPGFQQVATHTTPFAPDLQALFARAVAAGCQSAIMEVSSHALAQRRVLGCPFAVAVFTNLTQDHLDYHPTMEDYFEAKALLFGPEYLQGRGIINADDPYGQRLIQRLRDRQAPCWSYSTEPVAPGSQPADLWVSDLVYSATGVSGQVHTPMGSSAFESPLVGKFNLANLLAAIGVALDRGLSLNAILTSLPRFAGVPGRMERVQVKPNQDITVIVDYAHTPDSLENLLKASRPFISGQLICVFGCGGDRDRTKRPLMGGIVAQLADQAIVTSDNPRTEDPQSILRDVMTGIPTSYSAQVLADRAEAIRTAICSAKAGDGVLIAGKGHEDYQILGTEKVHFDDREQARDALGKRYG
jgi:UDP-N-acetylmuramoyl-L-alanyl-D-glutamate--2,6-diaminopimelate ligase